MIILYIISGILLIGLCVSVYININLTKKTQLLISFLEQRENDYAVVTFLQNILNILIDGKNRMDKIDRGGSFKTDDEVGFMFNSIKNVVDELTEKIKIIYEETKILEGKINVEIVKERETVKPDKKEK